MSKIVELLDSIDRAEPDHVDTSSSSSTSRFSRSRSAPQISGFARSSRRNLCHGEKIFLVLNRTSKVHRSGTDETLSSLMTDRDNEINLTANSARVYRRRTAARLIHSLPRFLAGY